MNKMVLGSAEYDAAVEREQKRIRGNKVSKTMTSEECAQEVASIVPPVFDGRYIPPEPQPAQQTGPKRRGRPPGSKNRPKLKVE